MFRYESHYPSCGELHHSPTEPTLKSGWVQPMSRGQSISTACWRPGTWLPSSTATLAGPVGSTGVATVKPSVTTPWGLALPRGGEVRQGLSPGRQPAPGRVWMQLGVNQEKTLPRQPRPTRMSRQRKMGPYRVEVTEEKSRAVFQCPWLGRRTEAT